MPDSAVDDLLMQLRIGAAHVLARYEAALSPDGWIRLEELLAAAADRLEADGQLDDTEAVGLTGRRLIELLRAALRGFPVLDTGDFPSFTKGGDMPDLDVMYPPPFAKSSVPGTKDRVVVITRASIDASLRMVCPGFWPFC